VAEKGVGGEEDELRKGVSVRVSARYAPVTCFGFSRFFFRPPFSPGRVQQPKLDGDKGSRL
jgi:hypothetical protein